MDHRIQLWTSTITSPEYSQGLLTKELKCLGITPVFSK